MRIALCVVVLLLPSLGSAGPAEAAKQASKKPARVRCDAGETIGGFLARADRSTPTTVTVSGTCPESVLVSGFDDLRFVGLPGATLAPVAPIAPFVVEVRASRSVSFEGLTVNPPVDGVAFGIGSCANCQLRGVTVTGGVAVLAYHWSKVTLSGVTATGVGGWASVGAWQAFLWIEDSLLEDTAAGDGRWCGLCVGQNSTVNVFRSTIRGFGAGVQADYGAFLNLADGTSIEDNWCYGLTAGTGGQVNVSGGSRVVQNGSTCYGGGINVERSATLSIDRSEVSSNTGGGIRLNHHGFAAFGAQTLVVSNNGPGLEARNLSSASLSAVEITGNTGADLRCDSLSHITNRAFVTGSPTAQCPNLWDQDGPGIP